MRLYYSDYTRIEHTKYTIEIIPGKNNGVRTTSYFSTYEEALEDALKLSLKIIIKKNERTIN